jgi:hypothetical protein
MTINDCGASCSGSIESPGDHLAATPVGFICLTYSTESEFRKYASCCCSTVSYGAPLRLTGRRKGIGLSEMKKKTKEARVFVTY